MTRYILTRIFVASLVFLGDWAIAAENRQRVDFEAAACEIKTQLTKQTIPDDWASSLEPAIIGDDTAPPVVFTINRKLALVAYTEPGKLKYQPLHPRAPPQTATL